jgi:hypothetical protein
MCLELREGITCFRIFLFIVWCIYIMSRCLVFSIMSGFMLVCEFLLVI